MGVFFLCHWHNKCFILFKIRVEKLHKKMFKKYVKLIDLD